MSRVDKNWAKEYEEGHGKMKQENEGETKKPKKKK